MDAEKIDIFNPAIVFAFVAAFIGDFTFFLVITHYLCGIIVLAMFFPKSRGFLAKGVLLLAFLLPLPTLMIGIFLAIILSNKVLAFIAEQVAIQVVAVFTAGAGETLEGVAVGEAAVETGAAVGEAALEVGTATAETAGTAVMEGAEIAGEAAEDVGEGAESTKETFGKTKDVYGKVKDISDRLSQGGQADEKEGERGADNEPTSEITGEGRALLGEEERLNQEFFEQPMQIPLPQEKDEIPKLNNVISGEKFREAQKIQDIKRQQHK